MKATLWTKNFTIITLGTIASAIGDVSMSFAFSFAIYDQSQSTFLAGLFSALGMLPRVILPLAAGPMIDRMHRKPLIVGLDALSSVIYISLGLYLMVFPFSFFLYLLFSLIISCVGSVYQITFQSLYPKLIPEGFSQKGYTVSGMIYPTVMMVMTPVAAFLYENLGMQVLAFLTAGLALSASLMETRISVEEIIQPMKRELSPLRQYVQDVRDALTYLNQEKGLKRIYQYMPITQGIGAGTSILIIAWFRTAPQLGIELYSFFTVAEFIGRTIGGLVHYRVEIPAQKRFSISYFVYQFYSLMDTILLVLPYPLMLVNRAICGFLGINSATLRESSVQNYVPDTMRAKINAFFNVLFTLSSMFFQLTVGAVGEVLPAPVCMALFGIFNMCMCWLIVYHGKEDVKPIYNHVY